MAGKTKAAQGKPATAKRASSTRKRPAKKDRTARVAENTSTFGTAAFKAEQPLMKALRAEHRHMGSVMQLFAAQLNAIEAGELVDAHVVYEIMHYMVTWPDRFHHPREDLIYARVAEVEPRSADDVDTLQRDHDNTAKRGRELLRNIERWRLAEVDGTALIKSGRAYINHIYEHMNVEEKLVFPKIESALTLQDWHELAEDDQLRAVAKPVFGPLVQREFRNMARKLRRGLRRSVERETLRESILIDGFLESLEVASIAFESARYTATDSLRSAVQDALEYFREAPLSAPIRCATNNARVTVRLINELASISRETLDDLSRVNQERKDRVRLLARSSAPR